MLRSLCLATAVLAAAAVPASAQYRRAPAQFGNVDALVARYSAEYNVPQSLIRRVIRRESGGRSHIVYRGNYGLMQIKPGTARSMGYRGGAAGLLDPDTNMRYAVKYLAGAWRLAGGSEARAVHYYAAGYYYAAKRRGIRMPAGEAYAMAGPRTRYAMAARPGWNGSPVDAGPLVSPASPNFR
jgi:soluble lytic murein transglycosylase-like protein